jgi:hypothetical protein
MRAGVAIVCALLIGASLAVDRSNFKKCSESSFCQRNRAIEVCAPLTWTWRVLFLIGPTVSGRALTYVSRFIQGANTPFVVVAGTVIATSQSITFDLKNSQTGATLITTLSFLDGTVRVHVNDKHPIRPRHEVG